MTTGLTYAQYVTQIATLAVVDESDAAFVTTLPQIITYAENRLCRDLDFLSTVQTSTSYATTASIPTVVIGTTVAAPAFVTIQEVNVITPAGTSNPNLGTVVPLLPVTKEFLRAVYPSAASKATPQFMAMLDQATVQFGPWPDAAYTLQVIGTQRPDSLSATNSPTFISTYLPDLFIMASMIYVTMYQRNFGKVGTQDEPEMGVTFESQYATLLKSAAVEEARKKFQASGWTSMSPPVAATPGR